MNSYLEAAIRGFRNAFRDAWDCWPFTILIAMLTAGLTLKACGVLT